MHFLASFVFIIIEACFIYGSSEGFRLEFVTLFMLKANGFPNLLRL